VGETVGVVAASADAGALDALVVPGRARACRVAEDELLLVCDPEVADEIARETGTRLTALDPDAIVLDATDGWAAIALEGRDADLLFARLSRLPLPSGGFVQGEVAHVPAKVLVDGGRLRILVATSLEHHLRSRVTAAREAGS